MSDVVAAVARHGLRPVGALGVPGMRELAPGETQHLERLRTYLAASRADVRDPAALDVLLHSARSRPSLADQDRDAMLAALGVGIGDVILARTPGARWVLRTSGSTPAPALLDPTGTLAVVPLDDVQRRWAAGEPGWVPAYVTSASRHLGGADASAVSAAGGTVIPAPRPPVPALVPLAPRTPASARAAAAAAASPDTESSDLSADTAPRGTPAVASRRARPRTPADLDPPPSRRAQGLALDALDLALGLVFAGGATSPFALVDDGGRRMRRFDDVPGATVADARAWVAASGASCAAVGWCGRLDDDGQPVAAGGARAVLVAASDAGRPGLVVAHRFITAGDDDTDAGSAGVTATAPRRSRTHRADVDSVVGADGSAAGARPVGDVVLVGPCPAVV